MNPGQKNIDLADRLRVSRENLRVIASAMETSAWSLRFVGMGKMADLLDGWATELLEIRSEIEAAYGDHLDASLIEAKNLALGTLLYISELGKKT